MFWLETTMDISDINCLGRERGTESLDRCPLLGWMRTGVSKEGKCNVTLFIALQKLLDFFVF